MPDSVVLLYLPGMIFLKGELEKLDDFEAEGARICSRVWNLDEGEKPSKFLYQLETSRARKKLISSVRGPGGNVLDSAEGVTKVYR